MKSLSLKLHGCLSDCICIYPEEALMFAQSEMCAALGSTTVIMWLRIKDVHRWTFSGVFALFCLVNRGTDTLRP